MMVAWYMPAASACRRLKQEDHRLEASLATEFDLVPEKQTK